jgi:hypothetical protein
VVERKPDNGIEVQNAADVTTGIMLQLKFVKSANNEFRIDQEQFDEDELQLGKGTRVCLQLCKPFFKTGRLVTGDSYFASVEAATILSAKGLKFIGNVKTCSSGFPKTYFDELHMFNRGDRSVLVKIDEDTGETELVAMAHMDNYRRMFIGTAYGLGEGELVERKRDRQDDKSHNAPTNKVIIDVEQPLMIKTYHDGVGGIDGHNRIRTDVLGLDKIATNDWSKRVNLGILGMIMVDAALFYSHIAKEKYSTYCQFFGQLADELIDNTIDDRTLRSTTNEGSAATDERPKLRKTILKQKNKKCQQGRCKCKDCEGKGDKGIGNPKTTWVCSACSDKGNNPQQWWLCSSESRPECWEKHCKEKHPEFANLFD